MEYIEEFQMMPSLHWFLIFNWIILSTIGNTATQSIYTHYHNFEKMGRFTTLKKIGTKYRVQTIGCKKQGQDFFFCYSDLEKYRFDASIYFFLSSRLEFLTGTLFQTLKEYQVDLINQISGCRLTGRAYYIV